MNDNDAATATAPYLLDMEIREWFERRRNRYQPHSVSVLAAVYFSGSRAAKKIKDKKSISGALIYVHNVESCSPKKLSLDM